MEWLLVVMLYEHRTIGDVKILDRFRSEIACNETKDEIVAMSKEKDGGGFFSRNLYVAMKCIRKVQ